MLLLKENGNLIYFANGQIVHCLVQQFCEKGNTLLKDWSLRSDGCPSLECHKEYRLLWWLVEEKAVKKLMLCLDRKSTRADVVPGLEINKTSRN